MKLTKLNMFILGKQGNSFHEAGTLIPFSEKLEWKKADEFLGDRYDAIFCFVPHASDMRNINLFWFLQRMVNNKVVAAADCFVVDVKSTMVETYLENWGIVKSNEVYCCSKLDCVINAPFSEDDDLRANSVLRERHKGERCFICASGPSFKEQDISLAVNDITIALNFSFYHVGFITKPPDYYVFSHMSYSDIETHIDIMRKQERALCGTDIFYSYGQYGYHNAQEIIKLHNFFSHNKVYYIRYAGAFKKNMNLEIDLVKAIPVNRNTAISALMIALYMGCKEIYLLGCETDMLHHDKGRYAHFYSQDESRCEFCYGEILEFTYNNWIAFKEIKRYAEVHGVKIYNATPHSKLDIFERVSYEDIVVKV